ncbi:MAG TPA: GyrI-like domain-containing protein [Bacteroidia bacterium]|nr:GyrI-like domain-containing protein [Bacteroidia bacterium]
MNNEIQTGDFYVAGISVRTTNAGGQSMKDIGELWGRFFAENISAKIPGKVSADIYSIYTDYESDHTGLYTTLLGCRVSSVEDLPEGMTGKKIPGGKCMKFTCKGKIPDVIAAQWANIWNDKTLRRSFTSDYEVYNERAQNPADAEVDIFVAVK